MLGITHSIPLLELCFRDMTIMKITHTHTKEPVGTWYYFSYLPDNAGEPPPTKEMKNIE